MAQTVLVIESHNLARDSLCEFLRSEGFEIHGTASVLEGIGLTNDIRFDVVLCEIAHADAGGLANLMRVREASPGARLIAMTFDISTETVNAIARARGRYVQKPILFDELVAIMGLAPPGGAGS